MDSETQKTTPLEETIIELFDEKTIISLDSITIKGKKYNLNLKTQFYSYLDEEATYLLYSLNPKFEEYHYVLIKTKVHLKKGTTELTIEEFYKTKKEFEQSQYYTTRILEEKMLKA